MGIGSYAEGAGRVAGAAGSWLAELIFDGAGAWSLDVAGVLGGDGFDQNDPAFLFGDWVMQGAARDDAEVARGELDVGLIVDLDAHVAAEDLEEFVLVIVFMPNELTLELGYFYVLVVNLTDDFGRPEVRELGAGLEEIDGGDHGVLRGRRELRRRGLNCGEGWEDFGGGAEENFVESFGVERAFGAGVDCADAALVGDVDEAGGGVDRAGGADDEEGGSAVELRVDVVHG